jgi:hypothetical protein
MPEGSLHLTQAAQLSGLRGTGGSRRRAEDGLCERAL